MSLCCLVAYTHFDVTVEDNEKLVQDMMSPGDNLPKGVKLFFKMIQKCYKNKSIIPIIPAMCYSTEDTTDFIYKGYPNYITNVC